MRFLKNRIFLLIISSVFLLCTCIVTSGSSKPFEYQILPMSAGNFTLNWISESAETVDATNNPNLLQGSSLAPPPAGSAWGTYGYSATGTQGIYDPANDDDLQNYNPNRGEENDGLFNTSYVNLNNPSHEVLGPEYWFITEDDLQDLDNNGTYTDPGWIHLAHLGQNGTPTTYDYLGGAGPGEEGDAGLDIGDVLQFSFDWDNSISRYKWRLWANPDMAVVMQVMEILGPSTFDHLAITIKAGTLLGAYDINFNTIFFGDNYEAGKSNLDFYSPYTLEGTFSMGDFGDIDISHINILARDPAGGFMVPEPASMVLFGLGLLAIARVGRRKSA